MQFSSESKSTVLQLCRYSIVGVVTNVAAYLIYLLFTHFGLAPKTAMTLLYVVTAVVSFFGNRQLTFSHSGGILSSGTKYLIVHVIGYFLNFIILAIFVDHLGYAHELVQALSILIVAFFLFIAFKFFVFKFAP